MIINPTVAEIRSWPIEDGWYKSPSGDYIKLGNKVVLGAWVKLGDGVRLGNRVVLGAGVVLGDGVRLGDWVKLGDWVELGHGVKLGNRVVLRNEVRLGNDVRILQTPPQLYRSDGYIFIAYPDPEGVVHVSAGCRYFTFAEAREHWIRTRGGTPLGDETLAILDFLELRVKQLG